MKNYLALPRGVEVSKTGLTITAPLTFAEWESLGAGLQSMHKSILFLLGDWLCWGEQRFSEEFSQAIKAKGHAVQTLLNAQWVSSRIEPSRRRENLSWTHHSEVAALPAADQDTLLQQAIDNEWSTRELREAVREIKPAKVVERVEQAEIIEKKEVRMDFTKWTTHALLKFNLYAGECWSSFTRDSGGDCKCSDDVASEDLAQLLNAALDEIKRRGEWERVQKFHRTQGSARDRRRPWSTLKENF
jgi:hypothetical protein